MGRQIKRQHKRNAKKNPVLDKRLITETSVLDYYQDLQNFKSDKAFIKYGFADRTRKGFFRMLFKSRNYNPWLTEVQDIITKSKKEYEKLAFGELLQMGMSYASSRGKETELTTILKERFEKLVGYAI